ncbi:Flap structure-specific endonuclease [Colletotrichum truncatum]|uniref:Flap structure-specific endonuclease n=1 Tax=Colletotrichum truncatum TaxID=5467 RepID=A0ACC3Z9Q0_COLTU|nr:Flap structure-specific endonuclease [Colletotrichum truncatum]KAF6793689.1 Flap structure-specific endonuclease [Colletotrichum truncatum]
MGIKGIYRELGPGKRVSLSRLAAEHLESSGRPLRIAVDIAIWQFQAQAAKGGTNPAIRTLFYRLARLLGQAIHPIFVFDGPHKPAFKRNKRSGRGNGGATAMAKRLIRLFGFPIHDAPGEAEAECALLQQQGIVDAVLSEDVDTIMFGCTRTLRNWSAEGSRGSKTPTHVSMYDVTNLLSSDTGLDREGMVLVALMSGGDYIPEGIPGCGVKLGCEAAKAGFGKSLCRLKLDDDVAFKQWKTYLEHELRTNESGFFRVKHKALSVPDEFPNRQVLRHYTHPVVSDSATVDKINTAIGLSRSIDVQGLRYFVEETLDWTNKVGAVKLIRVLSQGLLVHKLLERHLSGQPSKAIEQMEQEEMALIKRISGRRSHHSMDGMPELRVAHIPAQIVGLDLSQELDEATAVDRQGLALNSDDEFDTNINSTFESDRAKSKPTFDPMVAESIWLPESLLKLGIPLTARAWDENQQSKTVSRASSKVSKKKANAASPTEPGSLDKWVQITKNAGTRRSKITTTITTSTGTMTAASQVKQAEVSLLDDTGEASSVAKLRPRSSPVIAPAVSLRSNNNARSTVTRSKQSRSNGKAIAAEPTGHKNPWAFASSQHRPRITKFQQASEPITLSCSPLHSSPAPPCTPLIAAPSLHIIDLSGAENTSTFKAATTLVVSSASSAQRIDYSRGAEATRPSYPRTTSKGTQPMKQTRICFNTDSSRAQLRNHETNIRKTYGVDCQPKVMTHMECKSTSLPSQSYLRQDLSIRTIKDNSRVSYTAGQSTRAVPRMSADGFFKLVEVVDEEHDACKTTEKPKHSVSKTRRESGVSVIDLTGDDK